MHIMLLSCFSPCCVRMRSRGYKLYITCRVTGRFWLAAWCNGFPPICVNHIQNQLKRVGKNSNSLMIGPLLNFINYWIMLRVNSWTWLTTFRTWYGLQPKLSKKFSQKLLELYLATSQVTNWGCDRWWAIYSQMPVSNYVALSTFSS